MTQAEWFAATNPDPLVRAVHDKWFDSFGGMVSRFRYGVAERVRLFACAATRMVWELLPTDARSALLMSERVAESKATLAELRATAIRIVYGPVTFHQLAVSSAGWASAGVYESHRWLPSPANSGTVLFDPMEAARCAAKAIATREAGQVPHGNTRWTEKWHNSWTHVYEDARRTQVSYLRDIFPPPDYVPQFDPSWLTSTVVALARQANESGDFSVVPILADALQDAGCNDETLLQCCRVPGDVHVRGNWVVDLVLGRE